MRAILFSVMSLSAIFLSGCGLFKDGDCDCPTFGQSPQREESPAQEPLAENSVSSSFADISIP